MRQEWKDEGEGLKIPKEIAKKLRFGFIVPGSLHGYCEDVKAKADWILIKGALIVTSDPSEVKMTRRVFVSLYRMPILTWSLLTEEIDSMIQGLKPSAAPSTKIIKAGFRGSSRRIH